MNSEKEINMKCWNEYYSLPLLLLGIFIMLVLPTNHYAQMTDKIKYKIAADASKRDSSIDIKEPIISPRHSKFQRNSLKDYLKCVQFEGMIETPIKKIKFYQFNERSWEPSSYYIYAANEINYTEMSYDYGASYPGDSLIAYINSFLKNERNLKGQELIDLAVAINMISSPGYNFNVIVSSWCDIEKSSSQSITDYIKKTIKPPCVINKKDSVEVIYFVQTELRLKKMTMAYKNKNISFQSIDLGEYGEVKILL